MTFQQMFTGLVVACFVGIAVGGADEESVRGAVAQVIVTVLVLASTLDDQPPTVP